ncbi:MAG: ATP-dependent zinc metalloprotease FtsH [Chitinophagales bacterium]
MENKKDKDSNKGKKNIIKKPGFNFTWIYGIVGVLLLLYFFMDNSIGENHKLISQNYFIETMFKAHDVDRVLIVNDKDVEVYLKEDARKNEKYKDLKLDTSKSKFTPKTPDAVFTVASAESFIEKVSDIEKDFSTENKLDFQTVTRESIFQMLFIYAPFILIGVFLFFMLKRSGGGGMGGGQIFNIGKSKAQLFDKNAKSQTTFADVAGLDGAKEEVMEIVDFLKKPDKYTKLGGKIPKGALLIGPPGTGKTLLAKAMAGEAKVPFFSISGSDFVEMFVGVGASRVRDLFKQAREKAPCIIFIDEIDAIGRARGKNNMQSNDERENTLNQLLVEMDGFSGDKGVIMLAATNRPDVLDKALLRPGRFDRQISVDRPDLKEREAIFKVHLKNIKLSTEISAEKLAVQTPGFVGADIANICNEAALVAARKNKASVEMDDFNEAIDRTIGGLEKKNKVILPEEKKIIAYHEAGHALCGWFLENAHPLVKVTIVPRGVAALGYAQYLPKEKYLTRTEEILDMMCMTMGGRAAERVIFDAISTGAQSDLDTATKQAYSMVVVYGMSEKVGNLSYYNMMQDNAFAKPYSDETARIIDMEIKDIVDGQYQRAIDLLTEKEEQLHLLAKTLLEKEVLFKDDLTRLLGPRKFPEDKIDFTKEPEIDIEIEGDVIEGTTEGEDKIA